MASNEHADILQRGVPDWNAWRRQNPTIRPDLRNANLTRIDISNVYPENNNVVFFQVNPNGANLIGADLRKANLVDADLKKADLKRVNLMSAYLWDADLRHADLSGANLLDADLTGADLSGANLRDTDLSEANLSRANLNGANLSGANLRRATLLNANLYDSNLSNCSIYGVSIWDAYLEKAQQYDLVITPEDQPIITVDNLEIAQFIYLLLKNPKIGDVIDTVAKKTVLILGRSTSERKASLEVIKNSLRQQNYLPIFFDLEKPQNRNTTETINMLAHLSRFIIADFSNLLSVDYELATIVSTLDVPIVPLFHPADQSSREYAMFTDLSKSWKWVLPIHQYTTPENLRAALLIHVIGPAEKIAHELTILKKTARKITNVIEPLSIGRLAK